MRVLLAYECGYGLGHLNRLAEIARHLKRHDIESVLASYRLDDADQFADAFSRVVQGPVWPSYFASERALRTGFGPSYATVLVNMGFQVSRFVAINQRAWATIIEDAQPFTTRRGFCAGRGTGGQRPDSPRCRSGARSRRQRLMATFSRPSSRISQRTAAKSRRFSPQLWRRCTGSNGPFRPRSRMP